MIERRRSLLYLPSSSEHMMAKAGTRGADVLVLDLEDGVHPHKKEAARDNLSSALSEYDWGDSEIFVRTNGLDTEWVTRDLEMILDVCPCGAVLPKCEDVVRVGGVASRLSPNIPLFLMIETAKGVLEVPKLAELPNVAGLFFGAADFREDLRSQMLPDEEDILLARSQVVLAARAAGIEAFDTPWFEYRDVKGLEASSERARKLGFDGKTAIHPIQIEPINRAFCPTQAEVERARQIIELMDQASIQEKNVATLDNEMIEALHVKGARRILRRYESMKR